MKRETRHKLEKRTIKLLEITKNEKDKYEAERKKLYEFYEKGVNENEWSKYIAQVKKKLMLRIKSK